MTDKILNRVEESLDDASFLLKNSRFHGAVDRIYLAAYHACNVLLYPNRLTHTEYEEALVEFNRSLIASSLLPLSFKPKFETLTEAKMAMDFGNRYEVSIEEVKTLFQYAKDFLEEAKKRVEQPN